MEIIHTHDPNIVIQRTVNEVPIDLEELQQEKKHLEFQISSIIEQLETLGKLRVPAEIDTLVRIEIDTLNIAKQGIQDRLDYVNSVLCQ